MIKVVILSLIVLTAGLACFQQTGEQALSDYIRQKEAAENILRNGGELDRANSHYRSALKIAQDMRWADGIAIAERGRADVAAANRDFPLAEKILLETKEFCISNEECSSGQLAAIFDNLMFLYVFQLKDIQKATVTIAEVRKFRGRLSHGEDVDTILSRYEEQIGTLNAL